MQNDATSKPSVGTPSIERVRHELKRRSLTVRDVAKLTPGMLRIHFTSDDLGDFVSAAPDDHIKVFVPGDNDTIERRDYTPRRFDTAERTLAIDFAVHDAGPITQWATAARPGDTLDIGGPRGSAVISGVERWLLIGDETALPAIGRRIEESTSGMQITSITAVTSAEDEQSFDTKADLTCLWAHRPLSEATDASALLALVKSVDLPTGTFVWVAAEASVTRAIRAYLVEERGYPLSWIKASGYWVKGKSDATEKFD
ncbi:MAG: siderophore-interacting protein [Rhizobiaceae bacterium]|nr:siderophore-interacting protein [Rhizobiaceae bacterium]